MTKHPRLSRARYLAIEDEIAASPEGRAFLRQRDRRARVIAAADVRRMMHKLMVVPQKSPAAAQQSAHVQILRQELQEMSSYIQQTRREIAALHPGNEGSSKFISATGELDAIVSATERATLEILKGAERIAAAAQRLPRTAASDPIRAEIEGQVMEIMTSCSFQDITGQRTTKVVNTLRYIEKRVNAMIEIWGVEPGAAASDAVEDTRPDAHLLNGPTLEGGVSQNDVDALFAEAASNGAMPGAAIDMNALDALFDNP